MPNWTSNYVEIKGKKDRVLEIKEFLQNKEDEKVFDFNKVYPMPEELNIEEGSNKTPAVVHYLYTEKGGYMQMFKDPESLELLDKLSVLRLEDPQELIRRHQNMLEDKDASDIQKDYELGKRYVSNIRNYGFSTWYDWCCACWGTKWNSCDDEFIGEKGADDEYSIRYVFDTAWAAPFGVLEKLSELYPDVIVSNSYSDEGYEEEHFIQFGGKQ